MIYYDGMTTLGSFKVGNPTTYNNGTAWTFTWEHGRQLATMKTGSTTWTNTYNSDGLRTGRTDGTTTYTYYYEEGRLSAIKRNDLNMWIIYDDNGPVTLKYGSGTFHYVTNPQGDVVAIVGGQGQKLVEYTYDAWGKVTSITGDYAYNLGIHNPILYRGYVYDHETGLYYCQSRYYDPEIGRFLNADAFASTGQGLLGNNMFAYCLNNPVRYVDVAGAAAVELFLEDGEIFDESDLFDRGGGGSAWDVFTSTLDSLASGFNMALGGGKSYPKPEMHHVIPHSNKKHTPTYEGVVKKYDFSLNSTENIIPLDNHRGRHTEGYHEFITGSLYALDTYAQGDKDAFAKGFKYLADYISENSWLPYARK